MSNQEQKRKPVWRINAGNGVPSDFGGFVIYENDGDIMDKRNHKYMLTDNYYFELRRYRCNITHYQTTRTKAAKYERVGCGECKGIGVYTSSDGRKEYKCPHCNGKGYTLEHIK